MYLESDEDFYDHIYGFTSTLESLQFYMENQEGIRMKGCHFNLAPGNILFLQGRILLADFRLSRFRNESSDLRTPSKGEHVIIWLPSAPLRPSI